MSIGQGVGGRTGLAAGGSFLSGRPWIGNRREIAGDPVRRHSAKNEEPAIGDDDIAFLKTTRAAGIGGRIQTPRRGIQGSTASDILQGGSILIMQAEMQISSIADARRTLHRG